MIVAVFHPPPIYLLGAWIRISEVLSIYLQYWSGASPLSLALSLSIRSLSLSLDSASLRGCVSGWPLLALRQGAGVEEGGPLCVLLPSRSLHALPTGTLIRSIIN